MDQQDHLEYQSVDTRTEVDNNCICLETACGDVDGDDCESGESSLRSEFGDRQDTSSLNGHLPLANKDAEKRLAAADPMDQSIVKSSIKPQQNCSQQLVEVGKRVSSSMSECITQLHCNKCWDGAHDISTDGSLGSKIFPFKEFPAKHKESKHTDPGKTGSVDIKVSNHELVSVSSILIHETEDPEPNQCHNINLTLVTEKQKKIDELEEKLAQSEQTHFKLQSEKEDMKKELSLSKQAHTELELEKEEANEKLRKQDLELEEQRREIQQLRKENVKLLHDWKEAKAQRDTAVADKDHAITERDQAAAQNNEAVKRQEQTDEQLHETTTDRDEAQRSVVKLTKQLTQVTKQRDKARKQREKEAGKRNEAVKDRKKAIHQCAKEQKNRVVEEIRDARRREGKALKQRDRAVKERDQAFKRIHQTEKKLDRFSGGCQQICKDITNKLQEDHQGQWIVAQLSAECDKEHNSHAVEIQGRSDAVIGTVFEAILEHQHALHEGQISNHTEEAPWTLPDESRYTSSRYTNEEPKYELSGQGHPVRQTSRPACSADAKEGSGVVVGIVGMAHISDCTKEAPLPLPAERHTSEGFNKEVSVESHPVHQLTHPLHSADAKVVLPEGDVTQGSLPHVLAKTSWNVRGLVTKRTYFEVSDLLSCRYYPSAEVMLMLLFQELMLEEIRHIGNLIMVTLLHLKILVVEIRHAHVHQTD